MSNNILIFKLMIVLAVKIHRETSDLRCTNTYISAEGKNDVCAFVFSGLRTHKEPSTYAHTLYINYS